LFTLKKSCKKEKLWRKKEKKDVLIVLPSTSDWLAELGAGFVPVQV